MSVVFVFYVLFAFSGIFERASSKGVFQTCYTISHENRHFVFNPGDYDPERLTEDSCSDACAYEGYQYAALEEGIACFCSGADIATIEKVGDSNLCLGTCSVTGEHCGTATHGAIIYRQSLSTTLNLQSSEINAIIGQPVSIQFSDGIDSDETFFFGFDDGSDVITAENWTDTLLNYTFASPGSYLVSIVARNSFAEDYGVVAVEVEAPDLNPASLDCPDTVSLNETFECIFSSVIAAAQYAAWTLDGNLVSEVYSPDPAYITKGKIPLDDSTVTEDSAPGSDVTWVIPEMDFTSPGWLTSVEMHVTKTGMISLLVLRPSCLSGPYCTVDNQCGSPCDGDTAFPVATTYQDTCITGELFCLYRGRCLPDVDVTSCPARVQRYEASLPAVARSDYDVTHKIDLSAAELGLQSFDLGNSYNVEAGDVMGFTASPSSALLSYVETTAEPLEVNFVGSAVVGDTLTEVGSTVWHQKKHSLRVTAAGSLFDNRMHFTLDTVGNHSVEVTLNSTSTHPTYSDSTIVVVCEVIQNLSVVPNLINLNFLQEFTVSVWIGAGDSVEYTWDFGDAIYTTERQAATIQESDNKTHSYSSYGPQQITVTAANNCGNLTESIVVNVFGTEQPIQRHHYDITPSSPIEHPFPSEAEFEFTFTLTVPFGEVLGTNVSVHISTSYYENSTADLFDLYVDGNSKKVSHFVRFTGIHTAQVTLSNPISEEVFEVEIESQERLSLQSSFQPMYILPVSSEEKLVPGYGNDEDSLPVEYPIYFVADVPHGTGVEFRVISFDDASPPTSHYPSSEPISHQFSSPGRYEVTVEIANSVSAPVVTSKTIYLYDSISNMQIIEGPQTGPGMEKRLTLNIDHLGYHPCIVVDFDDGDLEYYGNETTCVTIAGYEGAGYAGPFTTNLDHTYLEAGTKHVQIQAHNLVSNLREDIFFVVGEGDCRSPNLYIRDGYRYFNGPRIVLRTDFTYLRGATVLDCSLTDNVKYWFLSEYNPYNGTAIPGSEVNLTSLSPGDDLYIPSGTSSSEIRLPPYYLPVGFYRFTYTVVMNDITQTVDPVLAFVHEYMEVRQGIIQARIIEGPSTFTTLGSNQSLLLRPGNFSRDLDLEDQDEQTFDEFRYFCKRFYEEWPLNDNATIASGYFVSAGMVDFGGCFDEGPGRLDIAAPLYLLRGSLLLVNMTYNILVEVEREGRIGTTNLTILVVEGNIPRPIITFEDNVVVEDDGTVSLNPTEALRLDAKCDGDCEDVTVEWSFQIFNGTHYIEIDGWDLYSTGNVTQELYLSEDFFKDLVPYGSDLRIQVLMTSPSGKTGISRFDSFVNPPPEGGSCSVTPLNITLEDEITISCQGWKDEHRVSTYTFIALGFDQEEGETVSEDLQLFFGRHPKSWVLPPLGDSSNEYRLQLSIIITDTRGAWTTYDLGFIQVYPSSRIDALLNFNANLSQQYDSLRDAQDTFQINERILLDGALLNQYRSNSINKMNYDLAALGLSSDAVQDEGTASSPLEEPNEVVKITQSRESDRIKSAYLRSRLAKLTEQAPVSSVDDVIGVASATLTLTHAPEEQSHQFLESTSNSMLKMVDTMETVSEKVSGSKVLFAGFKMLICIGNMYQGSAQSIDDPMLIIDEHEQSEDQSYGSLSNRIQESSVAATEASQTTADGAIDEEKRNKAQKTVSILDSCMNRTIQLIFKQKQVNEPASGLTYRSVSVTVARTVGRDIPAAVITQANGKFVIPPFCEMVSDGDCNADQIDIQSLSLPNNPYNFEETSEKISKKSNIMSLSYKRPDGTDVPVEESSSIIEIFVPRPGNDLPEFAFYNTTVPNNETGMVYHSFEVQYNDSSITVQLAPQNVSQIFVVYLRHEGYPSPEYYDYRFFLPGNETTLDQVQVTSMANLTDMWAYKIFLDNVKVGNKTGKYIVGVSQVPGNFWDDLGYIIHGQALDWAVGNASKNWTEPYWLSISISGCSFWIPQVQTWGGSGCLVGIRTDASWTQCLCTHLTSFASTWIVPPAPLDFEYIFNNLGFLQNLTIYVSTIASYTLFFFIFIWARRKDKKDIMLLGVTPLVDNNPKHKYLYELSVLTGQRQGAGTDSKVSFIISGDQEETDVRTLEDEKRPVLRRGAVDRFLMTVDRPLGTMNYMRIWHDNSGKGDMQSWYLKYIAIRDLQTKERFYFIVNRWFSVVDDDGQVDRLVAVAGKEQMKEFSHVFQSHTSKNLNDGHLWISIYGRPAMSRFTRMQRVGCCMMALWLEMLVNIMWYKAIPPSASLNAFNLGPISMSPAQISIGIQSMLIVFPISLTVVQFFRKSRPRKKRESRIKVAQKQQWERYKVSDTSKGRRPYLSPDSLLLKQRKTYGQGPAGGTRADPRLIHDGNLNFDESLRSNIGQYHTLQEDNSRATSPVSDKPKKDPFMFPWWFVIIAWFLLILGTVASTVFTLFYGIQMGDLETREWLASELVSFFTGVFIAQPIKVVLIAMFITCLFRSPNVDEESDVEVDEEAYDKSLDRDEEWLHNLPVTSHKERKIKAKPPTPENLEKIRERRLKELQIFSVLKDILFYFLFLFTLMVVSYGNVDTWSYHYKANIEQILVMGDRINSFTNIKTKEHFWRWAKLTLVPNLEGKFLYNGDIDPSLNGFFADQSSYILGYPVLRQLRVKSNLCEPHSAFVNIINDCNIHYTFLNEDEASYSAGWTPYNETTTYPEYKYIDAEKLDGYPFFGKHALYSGGGYVAKLKGNQEKIMNRIDRLLSEKWLDSNSRALFVEISMYNAHVNLFAVVNLLVEFLPTGGALPITKIDVVRLVTLNTAFGAFYVACLVIFFCFILFFTVKQLLKLRKEKREYWKSFWNLCECGIIGFSVAACVVFFYRLFVTNDLIDRFQQTHGQGYIKLQYVAYWNELLGYMLGWLIFIGTLKFLKLLKFNRRIGLLSSTIKTCSTDLFYFAILFCVFFFAFSIAFYLVLNTQVYNYSDFIYTCETLVSTILGKFHFKELADANRTIGPILFFLFMGTITFILVNMFLTIINEAFSNVKRDISKQSNDFEVVDFMVYRLKSFFGVSTKSNVVEEKESPKEGKQKTDMTPMDEFPDKVNQLLNSISSVYFDQEKFEDVMKSMEKPRKGRSRAFISN